MCVNNMDQHLDKIIVMKQNTLEALALCHSTVAHASVVKGAKTNDTNIDDDNASNMTEQSTEKNVNKTIWGRARK